MARARSRFFFLQTRIAIPRYFSQSYGAYFKYIIHVHVHVHTRTVNVCAMLMISYVILKYAPYDWLKCNPRLQKKKNRCPFSMVCIVAQNNNSRQVSVPFSSCWTVSSAMEWNTYRGQFHRAAKQRKLLTRNICLADFLGYQPNLHVKLMYFGW